MRADRAVGHVQASPDLLVAQPGRRQLRDLQLLGVRGSVWHVPRCCLTGAVAASSAAARSAQADASRSSTPTEVKVAALVAPGDSTYDIARSMFLSPRTGPT